MGFCNPGQTPSQKVLFIISSVFSRLEICRAGVLWNAGCLRRFPPNKSLVPMFRLFRWLMSVFLSNPADLVIVKANPNHDGSLFSVALGSKK